VLEDCLNRKINIRQICVEFHHFFDDISRFRTYGLLRRLKQAGFAVIHERMCDITVYHKGWDVGQFKKDGVIMKPRESRRMGQSP
jgi:hypothetical protein